MKSIAFVATNNCYMSCISGVIDALAITNQHWQYHNKDATDPLFRWEILSLDGEDVRSGNGLTLNVDRRLSDIDQTFDTVIAPALNYPDEAQFLNDLESLDPLIPWLHKQQQQGAVLAAACSGTFLLARGGFLQGRVATTTWWLAQLFNHLYPDITLREDQILVEDDGIICAGAVNSYQNLALHLIEKFAGYAVAAQCARLMLIDSSQISQAPFANTQGRWRHSDELVLKAQTWIERNYYKEISLDDIADNIATSSRTLSRRFNSAMGMSPVNYLQKVRIEAAKRLLENSGMHLEAIIERVGYHDVSSFRRLFMRITNTTPHEYRKRFSHHASDGYQSPSC